MEVLTDPETGGPADKLRLFLIHFLSAAAISDAEFDQYSAALQVTDAPCLPLRLRLCLLPFSSLISKAAGCDLAALAYLRRWRSFAAQSSKQQLEPSQQQGGTTKAVSMFSNLISQSSNFVMAGVKNLVVKKHNLPVTKIVDDIMEQRQGKVNDDFRYLDPKILRGNDNGQVRLYKLDFLTNTIFLQVPRTKTPFSDAVVFVVGGGNYIEYQNLQVSLAA
jgi:hypothetical protein